MPKTPIKTKLKTKPKNEGVLSQSMEGYAILGRKAMKGYKWAMQRVSKDLKQQKRSKSR